MFINPLTDRTFCGASLSCEAQQLSICSYLVLYVQSLVVTFIAQKCKSVWFIDGAHPASGLRSKDRGFVHD